jgi:hypothetical protein
LDKLNEELFSAWRYTISFNGVVIPCLQIRHNLENFITHKS